MKLSWFVENIPSPPSSPSIVGEQEVGVETLMERMKRLSEKSESYQITQEELSKRFETVETQSAELAAAPQRSSSVLDSDIGLFIEDPTFIYQDFAKVSAVYRVSNCETVSPIDHRGVS